MQEKLQVEDTNLLMENSDCFSSDI